MSLYRNLMLMMVLLLLSGALCRDYMVKYHQPNICAVEDSSVVIPCSFNYPEKHKVQTVMWRRNKFSLYDGSFTTRFRYIGDKEYNCSFKINQVQRNDTGPYTFRFETDNDKYTGRKGSKIKVGALSISLTKPDGNGMIKEGNSVNLSCRNSCDGRKTSSNFTWLKDGEPLENDGPVLYFNNLSFTNSGNYSCSLKGQTATSSGVIHIDVEYSPKNTSLSIRPLAEGDVGRNFTLVCSSHAQPPVETYTLFRKNTHDDVYVAVDVSHQPVFFSAVSGWYFCSASNKHGSQNSTSESLEVKASTFTRNVLIITAVLLILITAIVILRQKMKRTRKAEGDSEEDVQRTVYVNWPIRVINQSHEGHQSEEATDEVVYTTVDFDTKRKTNTGQQVRSDDHDQSVIYSTVCRTQMLNPTYIDCF